MEVYSKKYNYRLRYHAKSGCTVLRQLFLELHRDEIDEDIRTKLDKWHNIQIAFPVPAPCTSPTITVVRNPYKRVVSMFVNRICGGPDNNMVGKKFRFSNVSFYQFVISLMELKVFRGNLLGLYDDHIIPQFINHHGDVKVVKLETLEEDLPKALPDELSERVKNFFARNESLWKNNTKYEDTNNEFVGTKSFPISYQGPWPNYKCFYNPDIMFLVFRIYEPDFAFFNYDPNVLEP